MAHNKELEQIKQAASYFLPKGAFIAGGALTSVFTGNIISDVDVYFKTKEDFVQAVCEAYDSSFWCVAATDRAVTFVDRDNIIQLMHFDFFETAQEIFDAFDYTVCMAAYDIDKQDFVFSEDFFKHASQRFLRFHSGTRYPYGSLMRVLKYQDRGYKIGRSDLLRIGLACQKVEITSWDDLAAAIGGQYGDKAKIETDKPFNIDNAMELFSDMEITTKYKEDMPASAYALLQKIGFDEKILEELQVEDYSRGSIDFSSMTGNW